MCFLPLPFTVLIFLCTLPRECIMLHIKFFLRDPFVCSVPSQGVWDMRGKQFFEGKTIRDWAIACFTPQQSVKPMVSTKQFFSSRMYPVQDYSVADPGCLSRIPDPNFFHPLSKFFFHRGSQIRIKKFKYFNLKDCF